MNADDTGSYRLGNSSDAAIVLVGSSRRCFYGDYFLGYQSLTGYPWYHVRVWGLNDVYHQGKTRYIESTSSRLVGCAKNKNRQTLIISNMREMVRKRHVFTLYVCVCMHISMLTHHQLTWQRSPIKSERCGHWHKYKGHDWTSVVLIPW